VAPGRDARLDGRRAVCDAAAEAPADRRARPGTEEDGLQLDLRVPVGAPVPQVADFIARCEDAGLHGVGVHDHPHRGRDVYVTLALAAARTRRLRLYPATSSPVVRHPLLLASAAHSLEEIAPGRVLLTLAPGFLAARAIGRPRGSLAAVREAVLAIRRLLGGEAVDFDGQATRLLHVSDPPTPVYLLAAGPRMVELAGEVADGAVLMVGLDPRAIRAARERLEAGARRAGRSLAGFGVVFIVTLALADRLEEARRWPRRWFAPGQSFLTYPSAANLHWLRHAGIELGADHDPAALDAETAARACEAFGLFGPAEHCRDRLLRAREEAGVDHVFLFPAHTLEGGGEMPRRELEALRRVILPALPG
jgi:5,10-methylenetetrahydromethanopterin reductase